MRLANGSVPVGRTDVPLPDDGFKINCIRSMLAPDLPMEPVAGPPFDILQDDLSLAVPGGQSESLRDHRGQRQAIAVCCTNRSALALPCSMPSTCMGSLILDTGDDDRLLFPLCQV